MGVLSFENLILSDHLKIWSYQTILKSDQEKRTQKILNQVLTFIGVSQNLALAWPQTIYNQVIGQGYAYENCFSSSTISYKVIQIFEKGKQRKKVKVGFVWDVQDQVKLGPLCKIGPRSCGIGISRLIQLFQIQNVEQIMVQSWWER